MKGLDEIVEENKKADAAGKAKIKLEGGLTVTQGHVNSTLVITNGEETIKFNTIVLQAMLTKHNSNEQNDWDINDIILKLLQDL